MGKREKRLERMRASPKGWRYDEVAGILESFGFTTDTEGGSHRVFRHPSGERQVLVQKGSGTVLPVYVKNVVQAIDRVMEAS